ncbi:long-chain fatty acid--CoA ligase [Mesobacillus maritimus]|uniref:long-chain fatty acid--CoA ligase n=1 Tax=Mesobacillus maritimus TaxID=1643336 RepID=UPI002040656B|nr:long-chain fatty acid--CoA ligase [Mesobacillus maritimus]MCM3586781.1 long-chain fatty acid--CoA ligase [Mesobacillus maritimus]MCM3668464.1 long-chain fatty acid--CoA ligase [Mesobacillus maritimus]
MLTLHHEHWPNLTTSLSVPQTSLYENLQVSARRYPDNLAIQYYGSTLTYKELDEQVTALAGYLQHKLGVKTGEKVLLFMQNSPQFVIGFYAILRANAAVVPINPMLTANELTFYVKDAEIKTALAGQELTEKVQPLIGTTTLENIVFAAYSDYKGEFEGTLPPEVEAKREVFTEPGQHLWLNAIEANLQPSEHTAGVDDLAVLPYTSGTTGLPKGCMHTNRSVQANTVGAFHWASVTPNSVHLMTLPLFHVTGMIHSMHMPIYSGGSMVIMTRWNRETAVQLIKKELCTHWCAIATMIVDFVSNSKLQKEDIASLSYLSGGGAALPEAVGQKLYDLTGLRFIEGYGLSETIAQTHFNPPNRPKMQCLGIPSFDVDSRIIDPASCKELGVGEVGEIIVNGPQVMTGYYNRDDENRDSFMELDGKVFFRTGDIGRYDEEGYFFIVDRVKRMINASGFKVWPTEVESYLYKHPAIQQACVVGVPDPRRGESVKAFVILNEGYEGKVTEEEIIEWAKEHMAAYKYPREVEFRDEFPMTSSGKILWRQLQDEEKEKTKTVQ